MRPSRPSLTVIQHDAVVPLQRFADWLGAADVELRTVRAFAGEPVPAAAADGLLVLGGRMNAHDDERAPWLPATRRLIADSVEAEVPVLGICLGHQLLALATGGEVTAPAPGHHGGNHPVRRLATGKVEITSQNHNFAVAETLPGIEVTHQNLNDGVIEGVAAPDQRAFSVQHHPEAGPGPRESAYLFDEFAQLMGGGGVHVVAPAWKGGHRPVEPEGLLERHLRRDPTAADDTEEAGA